ncbi:hypothetical protein Leryth_000572 [Lithospermum erythrorhizon]|nr:hypothetical protein Leryth_000572 [Lithospermum erythrorhizon]
MTACCSINGNTGNTLSVGCKEVAHTIDLSTRWDFNEVANPPNLTGFITGSTAPQLTGNIPSDGPLKQSSRFNNELSLTLATSHPSIFGLTGIQDQFVSHSSISDHSLKNQHLVHKETLCNLDYLFLAISIDLLFKFHNFILDRDI